MLFTLHYTLLDREKRFSTFILYLQKEKNDWHGAGSQWKCVFSKVKWGREIFLALLRAVDLSNVGLTGVAFIKSV